MKRLPLLSTVVMVIAASVGAATGPIKRAVKPIKGEYIVILNDDAADIGAAVDRLSRAHGGHVVALYGNTIKGAYVRMKEADAQNWNTAAEVQWVEENSEVFLTPTQGDLYFPAPGSLDRIDRPSPTSPRFSNTYTYNSDGSGVRVYIVDTGVRPDHTEFNTGQVDAAASLASLLAANSLGLGTQCWVQGEYTAVAGHGTAVASLVGGRTFGTAKAATIVDARAFRCGSEAAKVDTVARVLLALDWIPVDPNRGTARQVVNTSFAIPVSWDPPLAINATVNSLVNRTPNIIVVTAAGNGPDHTFFFSPASATRAITVAGLNALDDTRWAYSNYGSDIDIFAQAQFVNSAHNASTTALRNAAGDCVTSYPADSCISGTSFSSPLVAGSIARYLQTNPSATRDQAMTYLSAESSSNTGTLVDGKPLLSMTD